MKTNNIKISITLFLIVFNSIHSFSQTDDNHKWYKNDFDTDVVYIGSAEENSGMALFYDKSGKKISFIGGSVVGGHARFYNQYGETVAYIGTSKEGVGLAKFSNTYGDEVVYIGSNVNGSGLVQVDGVTVNDYAEIFELVVRANVIPGTVMSMKESGEGLEPSNELYDTKVVGVISGAGGFTPGMVIGTREDGSHDLPVAVSGQVYVRVCVEGGEIKVGDLLVSSSQPGVAMRASDINKTMGTVIGKALEPYTERPGESEGLIRMLVMNR